MPVCSNTHINNRFMNIQDFCNTKKITSVIFDLDGTLIDSTWIWKEIDKIFLNQRGIHLPSDLQREIEGMSFTETAIYFKNRFALRDSIEDIMEEWNSMAFRYYQNAVQLKEGAAELIQYLKDHRLKLGIGTSNSRELTFEILKRHGLLHCFDAVTTACDVKKGKPSPDIFLYTSELLKTQPCHCLVFEDTYAGVLAARRAGMNVFAVADEISIPYKDEISNLADCYITNFKE